jgi:hypothetical protein
MADSTMRATPQRRCSCSLGVHERTIMSVLGWSTTAMVSRYAHVVAPIHSDVASRLDVLLWSSPNSERDDRNIAR